MTPVFRSVFIRYFPILGAFSPDLWVQQLRVLSRFVATLIASWFSFQLLHTGHRTVVAQSKPSRTKKGDQDNADSTLGPSIDTREYDPTRFTGKTLDLTLFAAVRAADVVVGILWGKWRQYRTARNQWSWLDDKVARLTDAGVFATSAGIVMWAWFYLPERLPRAYNMWIGEAAQVDNRLVEALRRARRGTFIYGKETGQAPLLESMCRDYGWPIEWGDPARTIPIPCEMVHMGVGPSCELHALSRFFRAFRFAMLTYLPLQLAMRIRSRSFSDIVKAFSNAIRSSTFLGAFISLFYYSVCLSRTRLGPRLFDRKTVSPLMWDSGLCVAAGCIMCGWSILLENAHKRQEIAFFVATRALATVLPRRYEKKVTTGTMVPFPNSIFLSKSRRRLLIRLYSIYGAKIWPSPRARLLY